MSGAEGTDSVEERLQKAIEKIDILSRNASDSATEKLSGLASSINKKGHEAKEKYNQIKPKPKDKISKSNNQDDKPLIRTIRDNVRHSSQKIPFRKDVGKSFQTAQGRITGALNRIAKAIINHIQYTLTAYILFGTIVWISYSTEGTIANQLLVDFCSWSGFSGLGTALIFIWGYPLGAILTVPLQNAVSSDPTQAMDLTCILLLFSSLFYFFRIKFAKVLSFVALSIPFFARIQYPMSQGAKLADFQIPETLTVAFFTVLFIFLFQLPRFGKKFKTSDSLPLAVDSNSIPSITDEFPEFWVDKNLWIDIEMTDPTEALPRPERPRGRSEYEMYEWVLLLVNILLWPISILTTMVVGAQTEFMGMGPFDAESNWLLLVGAWLPTMFFFYLLYRMDKAARDGQTYHMEKVAYQEAMTRYTEAKNTYFELLTLQAEVRKQEIRDENPNLPNSETASVAE